jgi:hypothetical protein
MQYLFNKVIVKRPKCITYCAKQDTFLNKTFYVTYPLPLPCPFNLLFPSQQTGNSLQVVTLAASFLPYDLSTRKGMLVVELSFLVVLIISTGPPKFT